MYSRWDGKTTRRMKAAAILWAGLACFMFTFPARATAAADDLHSSSVPDNVQSAADAAAPARGPRARPERTSAAPALRSGAQPNAGSKGRNSPVAAPSRGLQPPQRGTPQMAGGSAHDVHSLLNTQTRGRVSRQASRPIGSNRAAAGGRELRAPGSMGSPSASTLPALKRNVIAAPRSSAIGGPRVQSAARLGGAPGGRTNHSMGVDGTQLHRKF